MGKIEDTGADHQGRLQACYVQDAFDASLTDWENVTQRSLDRTPQRPNNQSASDGSLTPHTPRHDVNVASPIRKYYNEDEAKRRRECFELCKQKKEVKAIQLLSEDALPNELVMRIFEVVVTLRLPNLHLTDKATLTNAVTSLLGNSATANKLKPIMTQALLETARVRLPIAFSKSNSANGPTIEGPTFVFSLPHRIRHLELFCLTDLPDGQCRAAPVQYPANIYRFTKGMSALKTQFPDLHTFTLTVALCMKVTSDRPAAGTSLTITKFSTSFLDWACRSGFATKTTFRAAIRDLLGAVRDQGPGRQKSVNIVRKADLDDQWQGKEILLLDSENIDHILIGCIKYARCLGRRAGGEGEEVEASGF